MNSALLWLTRMLGPLWTVLGADTPQLVAILRAKLLADDRRPSALGKPPKEAYQQYLTYAMMTLMGGLLGMVFVLLPEPGNSFTIYFFFFTVYLAFLLISDFTEVLLDARDNYILAVRPVSNRTLSVARLLHVSLYLGKLTFFFTLITSVIIGYQYGIGGVLLFPLLLVLALVLVVMGVSTLYFVMLHFLSAARFREWISYFQIGFSVLIFSIYYFAPRIVEASELSSINLLEHPLAWVFPGAWLAGLFRMLYYLDFTYPTLPLAVLGVLVPIGLLVVAVRSAPALAQRLLSLGLAGSGEERETIPGGPGTRSGSWYHRTLSRWLTRPGLERQSYYWTNRLMDRSRVFKLRTYPIFGMVPVLAVYFLWDTDFSSLEELRQGRQYVILLYLMSYLVITPLIQSTFSDRYRAAWMWQAHPLSQPGAVQYGRLMGVVGRFLVPVLVLMTVMVGWLWGWTRFYDALVAGAATLLIAAIYLLFSNDLPFTQQQDTSEQTSNTMLSLVILSVTGAIGGLHYLAAPFPWLLLALGTVIVALCTAALWGLRRQGIE